MYDFAHPSVQSLLIEMRFNGQILSTGTGFLTPCSKGMVLITNRHNVTGRHQDTNEPLSPTLGTPNEILIHHHGRTVGTWTSVIEPLYDPDDIPLWIEHPTLGARADFIALPLTNGIIGGFPYSLEKPAYDMMVGPADSVSVVGFPFGLRAGGNYAIWVTGSIASEPFVDFNGLPLLLIDCRTRPGQSGSPVIAYRTGGAVRLSDKSTGMFNGPISKLIGIYSGRINKESDLGFVWKASAIQELVGSI